ncbi:Uncharacterised protein [Chlamydia trachomatis]|nr:Uncharacterised protein [Chlamydia trachomatis]
MHDKIIFLLPLGDIIYLFMILIMFLVCCCVGKTGQQMLFS